MNFLQTILSWFRTKDQTMRCNEAGLSLIKKHEKCKLKAYPAAEADHWAIGWGTTHPWVYEGMTCTQAQADAWFQQDVDAFATALTRMVKVPLNTNQFSALVSFVYNIGPGNFAMSSVLALLNSKRFDMVPAHMAQWNKMKVKEPDGSIKVVVSEELTRRRADEIAIFNTPVPLTAA